MPVKSIVPVFRALARTVARVARPPLRRFVQSLALARPVRSRHALLWQRHRPPPSGVWRTGGPRNGVRRCVPVPFEVERLQNLGAPKVLGLRAWHLDKHTRLPFCLADTDEPCEPPAVDDSAEIPLHDGNDAKGPAASCEPGAGEGETGIDVTVEIATSYGRLSRLPLSHVSPLQPALRVTFTKWSYWERARDKAAVEPVLQTYEIPLADFVASNPDFHPVHLREIRFRFDRTRSRVILLDQVGFVSRRNPGL